MPSPNGVQGQVGGWRGSIFIGHKNTHPSQSLTSPHENMQNAKLGAAQLCPGCPTCISLHQQPAYWRPSLVKALSSIQTLKPLRSMMVSMLPPPPLSLRPSFNGYPSHFAVSCYGLPNRPSLAFPTMPSHPAWAGTGGPLDTVFWMKERDRKHTSSWTSFSHPTNTEGFSVSGSGFSLRSGSSATSSVQHPRVSGPSVGTEIVVEQLLSPNTAPGLGTQWWDMR